MSQADNPTWAANRSDLELQLIKNLYYDLARLTFDYDSAFDELILIS